MSFLNQVELSVYKPNTQKSPIARRREKLAFKLEEQLKLASDSTYQPTKIVWNTDSDGNQHKVEQPKRIKRWWIEHTDGSVQLTVRYGSRALELAKGKNAIVVNSVNELPTVLKRLSEAVDKGEFDKLLEEQASYGKRVNTAKN